MRQRSHHGSASNRGRSSCLMQDACGPGLRESEGWNFGCREEILDRPFAYRGTACGHDCICAAIGRKSTPKHIVKKATEQQKAGDACFYLQSSPPKLPLTSPGGFVYHGVSLIRPNATTTVATVTSYLLSQLPLAPTYSSYGRTKLAVEGYHI